MKTLNLILLWMFLFLTVAGICSAEVLHSWVEPQPNHAFQNDNTIEYPFYTYTSKSASRSESGGSWSLTASATASANARAISPQSGNVSRQWDADAQLRATGDWDTLKPDPADALPKTADGVEKTKTSSDGTTTARRKRKAHVVYYRNRTDGSTEQRHLDASTSGGKSETSVSPTDLDADPWAKSWLEVHRRINLNEPVEGSPFQSETPDCTSSGNGHTCAGATPSPKKKEVVYCRRGEACGEKPGVKGKRDAHQIDCPERTYKQGIWQWLMLDWPEDCKGEKWRQPCHSDPDNCSRSHLHLKPASEALENEQVINGYVVPAGYSVGACGEHLYNDGSDHTLQASCSEDDNCIATGFYKCQHTAHEYALIVHDFGETCSGCGDGVSYSGFHLQERCSACSVVYWKCNTNEYRRHSQWEKMTCSACNMEYHRCQGHTCAGGSIAPIEEGTELRSKWDGRYRSPQPPTETNNPPTNTIPGACGHTYSASVASSHREVSCPTVNGQSCQAGPYYVCKDHTHSYSSQTPTQTPAETPTQQPTETRGLCGHTYSPSVADSHRQVSCPTENGKACVYSVYYACAPHTHVYPSGNNENNNNNNGNNGNNADPPTNTPSAPSVPTDPTPPSVVYQPCGDHTTAVSGDHSMQASCSRDPRCIAQNFYYCQHSAHEYPTVSVRPCGHPTTAIGSHSWVTNCAYYNSAGDRCTNTSGYYRCTPHTHTYPDRSEPSVVCPADSWTNCGGTTSHTATCTAGDSYYTCASLAWHQDRLCTRCSQTYQDCQNSASACQSNHWHTDQAIQPPPPTTETCPRKACGETVSTRLAHKVAVCPSGCGNHYWTCIDGAAARHTTTYTCRRPGCGKSFTKCSNSTCTSDWGTHAYHWAQ